MSNSNLCKFLKISNSDIQNENSELIIGRATTVCGIQIPSSTHLCDFLNNDVYVVSTKQNRDKYSYNKSKNQKVAQISNNRALQKKLVSSAARNDAASSTNETSSTTTTHTHAPTEEHTVTHTHPVTHNYPVTHTHAMSHSHTSTEEHVVRHTHHVKHTHAPTEHTDTQIKNNTLSEKALAFYNEHYLHKPE